MKTRILYTKIWVDTYYMSLTQAEQHVFLYLLTNEYVTILHVYECPDQIIMFQSKTTKEELQRIKQKFEADGKIFFYNGYVYLKNAHKYETYKGQLNKKAKDNILKQLSKDVLDWYRRVSDTPLKPLSIPSSRESETALKETINHKSEIKNQKIEIINTNGADEKKVVEQHFEGNRHGIDTPGSILQQKYGFQVPKKKGISTAWQDQAFRTASGLQITFDDPECVKEDIKSRWLKFCKMVFEDKTGAKIKQFWNAYTYLIDYPPFQTLKSAAKIKYFFTIFMKGSVPTKEAGRVELSQKGNLPSPGG